MSRGSGAEQRQLRGSAEETAPSSKKTTALCVPQGGSGGYGRQRQDTGVSRGKMSILACAHARNAPPKRDVTL